MPRHPAPTLAVTDQRGPEPSYGELARITDAIKKAAATLRELRAMQARTPFPETVPITRQVHEVESELARLYEAKRAWHARKNTPKKGHDEKAIPELPFESTSETDSLQRSS
jgi:hypothetical protein